METINEVWAGILQYLHDLDDISETGYQSWITCIRPVRIEDTVMVVRVHTNFQRNIITTHYADKIKQAFMQVMGIPLQLDILTDEEQTAAEEAAAEEEEDTRNFVQRSADDHYTFENFVVGSSNKFAHAATQAVANNPARFYNPLFIYGGSGLGKTHLLYAICNRIKNNDPAASIIYTKGETLTNELVESIKNGTTAQFRAKYREADVLLVDDIQFIAGRTSTQEEFFHTFEALHQANKQIVLTSDRPPKEIATLDDRLRGRFEMGLLADVQPPDIDTRIAIVKSKSQQLDIPMTDEVARYIAEQLKNNVRQLDGAITRMRAILMMGDSMSIATAKAAIRDIRADNQPAPITVEKIMSEVSHILGVSPKDICSKSRVANISQARKVAVYVLRQITDIPMKQIGTELGNRDHSTIVYCYQEAEKQYKTDSSFRSLVEDIIKNVRSSS